MPSPNAVSRFSLQILDKTTGEVVQGFEPGSHVETDLVDELVIRAKGIGIGWMQSEAKTEAAIRQAWADLLYTLKAQVRPSRK